MAQKKKEQDTVIEYERTKEGMKIKGNAKDVKGIIWFDLTTNKLFRNGLLFFASAKIPFVAAWQWLKGNFPLLLIYLVVQADFLKVFLSG